MYILAKMDSLFIQYVRKVFESWTALRIAEQQSTAGGETKTVIQGLIPYITQHLTKQTDPYDVAGWLEDYLSEKLNIDLDDGSQDGVAKLIVEAYALQQAGNNKQILELLSKVPAGCDLSQCLPQEVSCNVDESDILDDVSEGSSADSDAMNLS